MEIAYCNNCGVQIAGNAFAAGKAVHTDEGKIYCDKCAPLFKFTTSVLHKIPLASNAIGNEPTGEFFVAQQPAIAERSVTKFYFCETCGKRITEVEIEKGEGRDKKLKGVFCKQCAIGVMTIEFTAMKEMPAKPPPHLPSEQSVPTAKSGAKKESAFGVAPAAPSDANKGSAVKIAAGTRPATHSNETPSDRLSHRGKQSALRALAIPAAVTAVVAASVLALVLRSGSSGPRLAQSRVTNQAAEPAPESRTMPSPPVPAPLAIAPKDAEMPLANAMRNPDSESLAKADFDKLAKFDGLAENDTAGRVAAVEAYLKVHGDSSFAAPCRALIDALKKSISFQPAAIVKKIEPIDDTETAVKPVVPATNSKIVAKAEDDIGQKQFAGILRELTPLLRQNRFGEAEKLLDEKLRDPACAAVSESLKREKSGLMEIQALRQLAIDALRAKNGSTVTLTMRGAKMTGTVKDDSNSANVTLAVRDGPEITIRAGQLDVQDVDAFAPIETGLRSAKVADDLSRRGLLFLAAGDMVKAKDYFTKARDAGLGDEATQYLERVADLEPANVQAAAPAKRMDPSNPVSALQKEMALDLGGVKLELVLIPAGEFEMGSNKSKTLHKVKISRPLYMGKYVVTQAQYERVMGKNPSGFKGESLPVETVSYIDAQEFCKKAGNFTKTTIRLPTEAEWEYACRAGTTTDFSTGDSDATLDQEGWYIGNSQGKTHPVGQKAPNSWGLYDMHGNVWQWCQDWKNNDYYSNSVTEDPHGPDNGQLRIIRGGSWDCRALGSRASNRPGIEPDSKRSSNGFRVVVPASTP